MKPESSTWSKTKRERHSSKSDRRLRSGTRADDPNTHRECSASERTSKNSRSIRTKSKMRCSWNTSPTISVQPSTRRGCRVERDNDRHKIPSQKGIQHRNPFFASTLAHGARPDRRCGKQFDAPARSLPTHAFLSSLTRHRVHWK